VRIFLSYASQDRDAARAIELGLREQGHDVFFDRDDLPAGEEFHNRIRAAIEASDLVVFLVSPDAVDAGSYTLTELEIAEKSWTKASGKLLPVILRPTPRDTLPPVVRSVTFLQTDGNIVASVAAAVHRLDRARRQRLFVKTGVAAALILIVAVAGYRLIARAPSPEITGEDGAPMVLVPAGTFTMGDDEEAPKRQVFLDAYYIDRFEVTTSRYGRFLTATGSVGPPDGWDELNPATGAQLPVAGVDWNDADAYCRWAGRRLPTEAEWEKAARGSDGRRFPWGNASPTPEHANYQNSSPDAYDGGLTAVGSFPAGNSPFGVSDLAGNVSEWVADWYDEGVPSVAHGRATDGASGDPWNTEGVPATSQRDVRNPAGPERGEKRVIRGGGRFDPGYRLSPVKRWNAEPGQRSDDLGFRCARDAE